MRTRRESIDLIRMFNRRYVPVMRLLDRSYLGTGSSTLEIAVLIEIGEREAVSARDISRLLSVDKGYLSRTIRRFEEQGLVARTASGVEIASLSSPIPAPMSLPKPSGMRTMMSWRGWRTP